MEISGKKSGDFLVIRLAGRLDANWCEHVQRALAAAVHDGEHRLRVDMAGVTYVSSAGLRVLLACHKQLRAIGGSFGVAPCSSAVRAVLELSGLESLIASETESAAAMEAGRRHATPSADYELFDLGSSGAAILLRSLGYPRAIARGEVGEPGPSVSFGEKGFGLGVGALGAAYADCRSRFGEFLAVAGAAAFQPTDGSSRPDFVVRQGALVPEGCLLAGLAGEGDFALLARFEARKEARAVGLSEIARAALDLSGAPAAAWAAVAETSGLIGAWLRKSPAPADGGEERLSFPGIRDWLSFTSERAFRDSTSLVVGVTARPGSGFDPLLRPIGPEEGAPLFHAHAAAFPYRPLQKGRIDLPGTVSSLFEGQGLQAVMHLLSDSRGFAGAGESEFLRGALWIAPARSP